MKQLNTTFSLSVSTRCFTDKEQAHSSCGTMKFAPREIDQDTFLSLAGSGYAFTYIFKGNRRKPELFLNTQVIIYDIDHCEQPMEDYIAGLAYKPSLGYTTYSNGRDGKFSFRLVYCLDTLVEDENTFNTLYNAIAAANGFGKEFDKRRINQLYFGSNQGLTDYQQYISHLVYSPEDFDFIADCTISPSKIGMEDWEESIAAIAPHNNLYETNDTGLDKGAYYENYVKSIETPLIEAASGTHLYYPEDYYAVPIRFITSNGRKFVKRWRDGEHRRKRLYMAALIMLRNVPDLTPDNLRFNLWQLLSVYYDNTCEDRITPRDIDGIVERALANKGKDNLEPTKHGQFRLNPEYWGKIEDVLAVVKAVRKERNMAKMEHYDPTLSVAANQREMAMNGNKLSRSTLYRYVKELGLKRDIEAEIIELLLQEPTITIKEIAAVLGKCTSTINRHIKALREAEQPRVKRVKKQWIVIDNELNSRDDEAFV